LVEPLCVLVLGLVLSGPAPALGCYLVFAGMGLGMCHQFRMHSDRTRLMNMRDAEIDARRIMERFRGPSDWR
jgi:hypothetical protein